MEASSSYEHVFQPHEPDTPWDKLSASDPSLPSMLHAKFWAKSIDVDRSEWENKQGGEPMEIEGSDVGPGCFLLDLGVEYFESSRLWVRKDYIRLYDGCNTYFNKFINLTIPAPSIVITGQPGVGKTYWIFYAIRRRLGEAKPFLWYYGRSWYLFVEDGVFQPTRHLSVTTFRRYLWTFVDADHTTKVPSELPVFGTKVFTIFTTSPQRSRWKPLQKSTTCIAMIMNPWTLDEIYWAGVAHEFSKNQFDEVRDIFHEYGPIVRLCINSVGNQGQLYLFQSNRAITINCLSMDALRKCIGDGGVLNLNASQAVFLMKRVNVDNLQDFTVVPMTDSVWLQIKMRFMKTERTQQLRVYECCERVRRSRHMASLFFGSMAQFHLQEGRALNLIPMVEQEGETAQWISQPQPRNLSMASDPMRQGSGPVGVGAKDAIIPVKLKPSDVIQFAGSVLETFQPGVFYVPKSPSQAFDSFILADGNLLIFQSTIEPSHQIKGSIMDFFSQPTLHSMFQETQTCFIFVIPPGETIVCPKSGGTKLAKFWRRVKLFSAEFKPTKHS